MAKYSPGLLAIIGAPIGQVAHVCGFEKCCF
jgi:hypothetical protein